MAASRFRARIYAVGVNRCVDVPQEVSHALGGQTHIRVKGVIGSEAFRSHIAPRGGGNHRLFIHSRIWRKLCIGIGDAVDIAIGRDDAEWEISIPSDLADAMPPGSAAFEALTIPNRKRFVDRIEESKSPETRKRRIHQGIRLLIERLREPRSG